MLNIDKFLEKTELTNGKNKYQVIHLFRKEQAVVKILRILNKV